MQLHRNKSTTCWKVSKPGLCILNKTKQKDELEAFNLQAGKQSYGNNEFRVAHRLRGFFYGIDREVIWLFQLIG